MRAAYTFLNLILLAGYALTLQRIIRHSRGLNALLGWWVGLGFFVVAPLSLMVFCGGYELPEYIHMDIYWHEISFKNGNFLLPYLVVWLTLMSCCLAIYFFPQTKAGAKLNKGSPVQSRVEKVLLLSIGITIVDWVITIKLVGGFEAFLISHWYERGDDLVSQLGDSFVLLSHISMANQALFTAALSVYTWMALQGQRIRWSIFSFGLLAALAEVVMTGNRIYLATFLLAFFTSCVLCSRKKIIVGLLITSPLLAIVFSAWAAVRHDLTDIPGSAAAYMDDGLANHTVSSAFDVTEGMDILLAMHMIRDFGSKYDYLYGSSYSRSILSFVPRSIFPGKPETFTGFLAGIYVPNVLTSLNATAIGEMYANFGPATLLIFPLFTFGIVLLSRWENAHWHENGLLSALLFVLMIWTARVTVEDSFVLLLLALCIMRLFRMEKGLYRPELAIA